MSLYSKENLRFGLVKEGTRGTAETTPVKWFPILPPDIDYKPVMLADEAVRGFRAQMAPIQGRKLGTGKLKVTLDAQTIGEFLYSLMGSASESEIATITIDATNNKLNFNIGAAELTATIASATYAIGLTQADTGSLCKAIKDAISAAEAVGTYTVTYSRTTKKFTITRSTGTFQILWKTGTNGSDGTDTHIGTTLGFSDAANSTGALTYTGASEVQFAFTHSFSLASSIQPPSYTFFVDWGMVIKKYEMCVIKSLNFSGPVDNMISVDVDFLFKRELDGAIGSPAFPTQRYMSFQHVSYKIAGTTNVDVKSWTLNLDNGARPYLALAQSQDIQDIIAPDAFMVSGSMVIHYQNETERNKMLANTAVAIRMLIEGAAISGANKWTLDLPVTAANYSAYPFGYEDNILAAKVDFKGYHNGTSLILPVLINQDSAYSA